MDSAVVAAASTDIQSVAALTPAVAEEEVDD